MSISSWVYISADQNEQSHYLMDGRINSRDTANPFFSSTGTGSLWSRLYVDATEVAVAWSSLPIGYWFHLHLESSVFFNTPMHIMSSKFFSWSNAAAPLGCLQGLTSDLAFWDRALTPDELSELAGIDHGGPEQGTRRHLLAYDQGNLPAAIVAYYAIEMSHDKAMTDQVGGYADAELRNGASVEPYGPFNDPANSPRPPPSPPPLPSMLATTATLSTTSISSRRGAAAIASIAAADAFPFPASALSTLSATTSAHFVLAYSSSDRGTVSAYYFHRLSNTSANCK
ncbi:hypothetical protein CYMTET_15709 [Cymbomonas tetramitiformis]|uniref:Uncharacterized protein n=1 Tax=Cymbomonas tetramitiformis TaxID=36881 RepID=A0AAE0GDG3_9CHLO|nr:hypothetical protein CYMTET_15709 [Cymbomonas tetramitiformis]